MNTHLKKIPALLFLLLCFAACKQSTDEITPDPVISNPITGFEYTGDPENAFKFSFKNSSSKHIRQEWRFGDDTLRTETDPTHIYKSPGTYTVELRTYSETGNVSRTQAKIVINADSAAQILSSPTGIANQVKYSVRMKATVASVLWTFHDQTPVVTSTELEPLKTYTPAKFNKVTAKITSTDGSVVTLVKENATIHGLIKNITKEREGHTMSAENTYNVLENSNALLDGDINTKFVMGGRDGRWFNYPLAAVLTYKKARVVKLYAIGSADNLQTRDPKSWELHGSNDGVNWEHLDAKLMTKNFFDQMTDRGATTDAQRYRQLFYYSTSNIKAFTKYRFSITANWGDPALQINEMQLFE